MYLAVGLIIVFLLFVWLRARRWVVIDGRVYGVERGSTREEQMRRATLLAALHVKLDKVVTAADIPKLTRVYPTLLLADHRPNTKDGSIAYSLNKYIIYICLDSVTAVTDALMFVALHELAHCALDSYDPLDANGHTVHSAEFYAVMTKLVDAARRIGVLTTTEFNGESFCGQKIQ